MVAPAFPGTQLMNVELFPYFDRLTPSMAKIMRGDLRDHQFLSRLAAHEVLRVNAVGSRIASGYYNSLLQYLVIKNKSLADHIRVTVQFQDYPADLTELNVPPGVVLVVRNVNYASYVPLIQCLTGDAEVEVMFFAYTTAESKRGDFLHVMPGETTWLQDDEFPTVDHCYLGLHGLYIPKPEDDPAKFGVNLYLPLSLRTKTPLYLQTLWAQLGSPTIPGVASVPVTIVGYDKAFQRLIPLGIEQNFMAFTGGINGYEDVYSSNLIDLAPYIAGNVNLESIGLVWSRSYGDQYDTLEAPVIFRNARTLQ